MSLILAVTLKCLKYILQQRYIRSICENKGENICRKRFDLNKEMHPISQCSYLIHFIVNFLEDHSNYKAINGGKLGGLQTHSQWRAE